MANTSYVNLRDQNGTIIDKATGKKYANPSLLAADLGITADKINWAAIAKESVSAAPVVPAAPIAAPKPVSAPVIAPVVSASPVSYADLVDKNGTIVNSKTGQGYSNNALLAASLGIRPDQLDWTKIKKEGAPITDPSQVNDLTQAKAFINSSQDADAASQSAKDEPPVRKTVEDYMAEIKKTNNTLSGGTDKPAAPNYEAKYTDLRGQYGVGTLEDKLNNLNTDLDAANASYLEEKTKIESAPEAMNVIEGRKGEAAKAYQDKVDFLNRQKNTVVNELTTKYSIIDSMMKYSKMTYDDASGAYDKNFTQNLQTLNLIQGVDEQNQTIEERAKNNAQANLNTMYNLISSNGLDLSTLSEDKKLEITKLELQAGLPVGLYQSIQSKNPKSDVIATNSWTDAGGKEYVSVITRDKETGELKTENTLLGQGKVSGNADTVDEKRIYDLRVAQAPSQVSVLAKQGYGWGEIADYFIALGIDPGVKEIDDALHRQFQTQQDYDSWKANQ